MTEATGETGRLCRRSPAVLRELLDRHEAAGSPETGELADAVDRAVRTSLARSAAGIRTIRAG